MFDENGILKSPDGKNISRPDNLQPNCKLCAKWIEDLKKPWDGWISRNEYYFLTYRSCKAFGSLPKPGGSDCQCKETMEILLLLETIFTCAEKLENKEFMGKMILGNRGI